MSALQKNPKKISDKNENNTTYHEQQIIDTSSIGVLITRIGDGTILYANKAITSLLGIADITSVIGMPVPNFYWDLEDRKAMLERFKIEGSITNNEIRARRIDGSMLWVSISIQPFQFEDEQVLLSEITDVSARKQAEEALHTSEVLFRSIYDNSTIGLYRTTPGGRILMINPTGLRLLGFDSFEEMSQRNLEESGFEQENSRKNFREKLEREGVIEQESEWTKKDGSTIYVREGAKVFRNKNGEVLYYDGSFEDITKRKQAEAALHESEDRFRRFTEATVEGLVFHEQGKIIDANPASLSMFGLSDNAEFIGRNLLEFIVPESHQLVLQQMQLEAVLPYEVQCVRDDGSTFPVETSTRTYKEGGRIIRASSIRDITERKQTEETLHQTRTLYQSLVEVSPMSICRKDLAGRFTFANRRFLDSSEITLADLVGKTDFDLHPSELADKYRRDDLAVMESGQVKELIEERAVLEGEASYVETVKTPIYDDDGKVNGIQISFWDITARKRAEEEMRRLQNAMEQTGDGVALADLNGNILYTNPAWARMHGYTVEEILGKHLSIFHTPEQLEKEVAPFNEKAMETGGNSSEINHARKDGSTFPTLMTVAVQKNDKDQPVGLIGTIRDITENKRVEQELQENRKFLTLVLDTMPGFLFWKDRNSVYLGSNKVFAKGAGLNDPSEIVGKSDHDLAWTKEEADAYIKDDRDVMESDIPKYHIIEPQLQANGKQTWVDTTKIPLHDDHGNVIGILGTFEDITERKQVEEELKRNVNFTNALLDAIPTPVFYKDKEGRYQGCNRAFTDIMGVTSEEIQGKTVHQIWPSENAEIYHQKDLDLMHKEEHQVYEATTKDKDEVIRPVIFAKDVFYDESGNVAGLVGAFLDITERKQAEEERSRLAQLVQSSSEFINMSTLDGRMIFLNNAGCEMVGIDPQNLDQHVIFEVLTEESLAKVQNQVLPILTEKGAWSGELQYRNIKTGELVDCQASTFMIYKENGEPLYLANISRDITENKKLELEVQEAFERRGYQVQVSTEISQEVASTTELSDLFERVVTLTKERLGYYHTQLLRYDADLDAVVLINGYGEIGQKMLAGGHQMPMGSGLIGTAAATGETILRPTLTEDPDWKPNPLLPDTKGEIAVPIKWQNTVLGVLDVQSDQAGALSDEDRLLFEGLCGQIAIAMHSAELVEAIRQNETRLAEALLTARLANWEYAVEKDLFTFNDQFYSIFHTTAEKAGGYQISSARYAELFVHPDDMGLVGSEIGKALSSTEKVYNATLDHRIVYEDGSIGYITVKVTVERDENGKVARFYGANQDITERKQAEEALRRSEQEMAERLEEINRLYQNLSHEGWKSYRETESLPTGFVFDQTGTKVVDDEDFSDNLFANIPMKVLGGEIVGTLTVANDPRNPTSAEDLAFFQQVSDQIALALEGARLSEQTQSALAQTEKLSEVSLRFARAANLQELLIVVNDALGIPEINRTLLGAFNYNLANELDSLDILANWWNGNGHEPSEVGRHYTMENLSILPMLKSNKPIFFNDTLHDENIIAGTLEMFTRQSILSMAVLPLYLGTRQIGVLFLEAEKAHNFSQEEIRLFSAMAPQMATVLENRIQFARAQQQADRESTLNLISQKIQSATTVEAVLQIAARELGHALGAPMTIAQLSMKDKK